MAQTASFTGQVVLAPNFKHYGASDLSNPTELIGTLYSQVMASGTGANQMNMLWHDQRSLAATTGEDLDLAGSLVNSFGVTMTFVRVKFLYIGAASANNGLIQVGGAAGNQFINWVADSSDIVNVRAGGFACFFAPDATAYAVTATTGDILKVYNSGAAAGTYDIIIGGASA